MSSHCTQFTMSSNLNVDGSSLQLLLEFSPWMHTTTVWIFSSHNYVKSHLRQKSVYCFSLVDVITSFLSSGLFTPDTPHDRLFLLSPTALTVFRSWHRLCHSFLHERNGNFFFLNNIVLSWFLVLLSSFCNTN